MEPNSIITVVSFLQMVIGGIVGNRTDAFFTNSIKNIYKQFKEDIHNPEIQEIHKAVRKTYLQATYIICRTYKEKNYELLDRIQSKGPGHIDDILNYIKNEVGSLTKKSSSDVPQNFFEENYNTLLKEQDEDVLSKMVLELKEQVILELENKKLFVESGLKKAIKEGLSVDDKVIDWYEIMKACFANELNSNSRLSTSIESKLLLNLEGQTKNLDVTITDIKSHLNTSLTYSQKILNKVNDLEFLIQTLNEKVSEIPDEIFAKVKDQFATIDAENLPNFQLDKRYKSLKADLNKVTKEELEIQEDIEDFKIEISESDTAQKTLKYQRKLDRAEKKHIEISRKKGVLQKKLESYVYNVLSLASIIYQEKDYESPRLIKVKEKFKVGQFEEANKALNENEIYRDIKQNKEKLKNCAFELFIKAKVTELNKKKGWFRLTLRYYTKSIDAFPNPSVLFEFALFLQNHNLEPNAIKYYLLALELIDDKEKKAIILNNLGNLISIDDPRTAVKYLKEALDIREGLAKKNPEKFLPFIAVTLHNLGGTQQSFDLYEAEISLNRALEIRRRLALENPDIYQLHLIETLNNLGNLFLQKNDPGCAKKFYEEGVHMVLKMRKPKSLALQLKKAVTYLNYGLIKSIRSECDDAGKYFTAALILFRKLSENNPYACLPNLAICLTQCGVFFSECKEDYSTAIKCYDEAIKHYKTLSKYPQYRVYLAFALYNYGKLLMNNEENDQNVIINSLNEALKIQKELAKNNPKFHLPYVANTLLYLSYGYLLKGNPVMEKKCQEEHAEILKNLPNEDLPHLIMKIDNVFD